MNLWCARTKFSVLINALGAKLVCDTVVRGQLVSRGHFVNTIIFQRIFIF